MVRPLSFFDSMPSPRVTRWLLVGSLLATLGTFLVMGWFFLQSGDTRNTMESQLSFSAEFLRAQYATIIAAGGLNAYWIAQVLDYGFMIAYGMFALALALSIARKFDDTSAWRTSGYIVAIIGVSSAVLDAVENAFILATLTDPLGFPAWWAIAHSGFALAKWLALYGSIAWAVIAGLALGIHARK